MNKSTLCNTSPSYTLFYIVSFYFYANVFLYTVRSWLRTVLYSS